jgi:hypothetical protein
MVKLFCPSRFGRVSKQGGSKYILLPRQWKSLHIRTRAMGRVQMQLSVPLGSELMRHVVAEVVTGW